MCMLYHNFTFKVKKRELRPPYSLSFEDRQSEIIKCSNSIGVAMISVIDYIKLDNKIDSVKKECYL